LEAGGKGVERSLGVLIFPEVSWKSSWLSFDVFLTCGMEFFGTSRCSERFHKRLGGSEAGR
jgi:hypothetical protein